MAEKLNTILCQYCGAFNSEDASWCRICGHEISSESIRILPSGTILDQGRYTISRYLGHGGSAITYEARQRNFTSEIAIREYYPSSLVTRDPSSFEVRASGPDSELAFDQGKAMFLNEGNNLRTLGSIPNIVQVHDVFEENGTVYMAEDFISGKSLSDLLDGRKKYTFDEAMVYIEPILRALIQVHSHGIIHRDIKPSNIMISGNTPYLIDFGISKKITRNTTITNYDGNRQKSGPTAFTRGYAAPEQITGQAREATWTDVYGIAATLYRMVTGNDPDDAEARLVRDLLPDPIDLGAALTKEQSDAIMTGLSLDTITRFQTIQAFLTALTTREQRRKDSENSAGSDITDSTTKSRAPIWAAAVAAIILTAFGLWKWGNQLPFLPNHDKDNQEVPSDMKEEVTESEISTNPEQGTHDEEKKVEEMQAEDVLAEDIPRTINLDVKILDSQREALGGYHVRVYQILTGNGQSTETKMLFSGQTDAFGRLPMLETELTDGFIRCELQESGNSREFSLKDIESTGGQVELSFPFHFYPETYSYGGHTYAMGNLYDASGLSSYDAVEAYCETLGGHLAVINNAGEDAFLYNYFCVPGVSTAFFGYTDQDSEGYWEWAYGNSDYTNWTRPGGIHPGPDNGKGASGWGPENYAEYNSGDDAANDGTWNDAKFAVNTSYFIIEWEFERPEQG